mmetsp:Transcript_21194/g.29692  ORF Transcript_21194/g.29692 Transcript_21194/m.29692 type:complete len:277 (+) Transcript_21194:3-833(+)
MMLAAIRYALNYAAKWDRRGCRKGKRILEVIRPLANEDKGPVLTLLQDSEVPVRLQGILLIHETQSTYPSLFDEKAMKDAVLPAVYKAITPDPSLVRTVNFGHFVHRVDDGVPLRRAAFKALSAIIAAASIPGSGASCTLTSLSLGVEKLASGLTEYEGDEAILAWKIIREIAVSRSSSSLLEVADSVPTRILAKIKGLLRKAKGGDNDAESAKEVLRETVHGLFAITLIPGAERCTQFIQFFERVKQTTLLNSMLRDIIRADEGRCDGPNLVVHR